MVDGIIDQYDDDGDEKPKKTWFRATDRDLCWSDDDGFTQESIPWKPSIHMPRAASRITLEIVSVRVERLQDVSESDAMAEGIQRYSGPLRWVRYLDVVTGEAMHNSARDAYAALWEAINGPGSWDANPWVWCISFKRIEVGAP